MNTELLQIIKWPITVFVIFVIILVIFKRTITDLIKSVRGIKYGGFGAEMFQGGNKQELQENFSQEQSKDLAKYEQISRSLGLISEIPKRNLLQLSKAKQIYLLLVIQRKNMTTFFNILLRYIYSCGSISFIA